MRRGFTLIELIFVIVILGLLSKFGAELLYKIYENYVYSNTFNRLENQSEAAVKQIANRLQYRIKDSTIARDDFTAGSPAEPIGSNSGNELVLEWMGIDIDGWQGTLDTNTSGGGIVGPDWSGLIDLENSSAGELDTPGTLYKSVYGAIFFIGSDVDLSSNFGWDSAITNQNASMHPMQFDTNGKIVDANTTGATDFSNVDVYEYYQFTKSAYAVSLEGTDLYLYSDYTPWSGERMTAGNKDLIMENVSTFQFTSMGDTLVVQVCVSDGNVTGVGEYSICKEKVVF